MSLFGVWMRIARHPTINKGIRRIEISLAFHNSANDLVTFALRAQSELLDILEGSELGRYFPRSAGYDGPPVTPPPTPSTNEEKYQHFVLWRLWRVARDVVEGRSETTIWKELVQVAYTCYREARLVHETLRTSGTFARRIATAVTSLPHPQTVEFYCRTPTAGHDDGSALAKNFKREGQAFHQAAKIASIFGESDSMFSSTRFKYLASPVAWDDMHSRFSQSDNPPYELPVKVLMACQEAGARLNGLPLDVPLKCHDTTGPKLFQPTEEETRCLSALGEGLQTVEVNYNLDEDFGQDSLQQPLLAVVAALLDKADGIKFIKLTGPDGWVSCPQVNIGHIIPLKLWPKLETVHLGCVGCHYSDLQTLFGSRSTPIRSDWIMWFSGPGLGLKSSICSMQRAQGMLIMIGEQESA